MRRLSQSLALALVLPLWSMPAPAQACSDPSGVCVDDAKAKWTPDKGLSRKQRGKEHKKNRKRTKVQVTVTVVGGRGSAFIDGRYFVTGEAQELAPGKHDVQVRDGEQLLAQGVLFVPRKAASLSVTVVHP